MFQSNQPSIPPVNPAKVKVAIDLLTLLIDLFATAILFTAVFSLPFPFVRQAWLKETLGLTGIINCAILVVIGRAMKHLSFSAPFVGLGLVFSELTLLGRSFVFLDRVSGVQKSDISFLILSFSVSLILAILFWSGLRQLYALYASGYHQHKAQQTKIIGQRNFLPVFASIGGYTLLGVIVLLCKFLSPNLRFSALKFIAETCCMVAGLGIATEIYYYLKKEQSWIFFFGKALSHLLAAGIVLLFLYKQISFQGMLLQ